MVPMPKGNLAVQQDIDTRQSEDAKVIRACDGVVTLKKAIDILALAIEGSGHRGYMMYAC